MKNEGRVAAFCAAQRVMRKTWTEPLKERVPVPKSKQSSDGNQQADFISCVAWEKTAEVISQYCTKGKKIAVEWRIQTRSYEKDGRKYYVTEVVVQSMEFCDSKRDEAGVLYLER